MIFEYQFRSLSKSMGSITMYLSLPCLSKRVLYVTYNILFNLIFLMPVNGPYPGINDRKWLIFKSIQIERTAIMHGRSLLKPNDLCYTNVLNFCPCFRILSSIVLEMRLTKIGLLKKCWKLLLFGQISCPLGSIDRLARYNNELRILC